MPHTGAIPIYRVFLLVVLSLGFIFQPTLSRRKCIQGMDVEESSPRGYCTGWSPTYLRST
ncbi:hypothetical protein LZ31DRAFT_133196 [Colletotrichum somersetense]|nr:hypothetical protein LZ31DRAFT_133196 [Colletotrichum somersetense]